MHLMNVITMYLYGSMDNDIYMKIPKGFKLPEANCTKPRSMYSIKLQWSLYGLKHSECMWYNRLSEYLIIEGYMNNLICPYIFIKTSETGFAIIVVYVDDLNLVGTSEELTRTINYLKKRIWDERSWKNKILSRSANRAFSKWSFSTSINIH